MRRVAHFIILLFLVLAGNVQALIAQDGSRHSVTGMKMLLEKSQVDSERIITIEISQTKINETQSI